MNCLTQNLISQKCPISNPFCKSIFLSLLCLHLFSPGLYAQGWSGLEMHGGGKVTGIIPHPTDPNILYHRTDVAGVNKTNNEGELWSSVTLGLPKYSQHAFKVRSFVLDPNDANHLLMASGNTPNGDHSGIWRSLDGGITWTLQYQAAGFSGNGPFRWGDEVMTRHPVNTNDLYAGAQPVVSGGAASKGGIYISTDNGATWSKLATTTFDDKWITKLLFNPNNSDELFIAAADPLIGGFTTTPGLWKYDITNGTETLVASYSVVDVDFDPQNTLSGFLIGDDQISQTTDGGDTWSALTQPNGSTYQSFVTPHPTELDHWFFGATNGFYTNGFLETTDALTTFHFAGYGVPGSVNQGLIFYDPEWADTNVQPVMGGELANFLFHPADVTRVYVDNVYRCDNATGTLVDFANNDGTSNGNWGWKFIAQGIYIMVGIRVSPHPTNASEFRINVADHNQYLTTDGGSDMLHDGIYDHLNYSAVTQYAPSDLSILYSGGRDHNKKATLNKSTDGGTTWTEISSAFFDGGRVIQDLLIHPLDEDLLLVGIDNNTGGALPSQIYKSTDGGSSFTAWDQGIQGVLIFKEWQTKRRMWLDADGQTVFLYNDNNMYTRDIDAANNVDWTSVTLPVNNPIRYLSHARNIVGSLYAIFGPSDPNIYWSTDHGTTWSSRALPFNGDAGILGVSPNGRLIVTRRGSFSQQRAQEAHYIDDVTDLADSWTHEPLSGHQGLVKNFEFITDEMLVTNANGQGSAWRSFLPLPVELTDFFLSIDQPTNIVTLHWQSHSEDRFKGYALERSADGSTFEEIGFVDANQQLSISNYTFADREPLDGKSYYRLRLVDLDGTYEYSKVLSCYVDGEKWSIQPTVVTDKIQLHVPDQLSQKLNYSIYSISGKVVQTGVLTHEEMQYIAIPADLPTGLYYLNLRGTNRNDTGFRFLKR